MALSGNLDPMSFRILIDTLRCKGCALCTAFCSRGVLKMSRRLNPKGYHVAHPEAPEECSGCRNCADVCPETAVEIRQLSEPSQKVSRSRQPAAASGRGSR